MSDLTNIQNNLAVVSTLLSDARDWLNFIGAPLGLIERYDTLLYQLDDLITDTNTADFGNPFAE